MRHLRWDDPETVFQIKSILKQGQVVLGDSDTVLGLLADVSKEGKESIDRIKKRVDKPYLIIVGDTKRALDFIEISPNYALQFEKLINLCWPGPVTLIFRAKKDIPSWMTSPEGTIAIRVPNHAGLQQLLQHFSALFSTSANRAGDPIPEKIEDVDSRLLAEVSALVVDGKRDTKNELPSTILDCTGNVIKVVRQGTIDVCFLAQASGLRYEN